MVGGITVTDDIVTRLREGYGQGCKCFARCQCECGCDAIWAGRYTSEAADEIERLRADRDRWKQLAIADHLDVCNLDDHELCLSYLEWKVSKAVRGE